MLAANAQLDIGAGGASAIGTDFDQLAHAFLVEGDEGVLFDDALLFIGLEEGSRVVTRDAEGGLGEIVGAEAEEFCLMCDVARAQGCAWQLDHGAD